MCDSIRPLAELEEATVPEEEAGSSDLLCKGNKLYIKVPCMDDVRMKKIRAILGMFPGESQAILYFEDTGKRWGTPCAIYRSLVRELEELLGEACVVVK